MIKAILWDVDGTLLNFKAAEKAAIHILFREFSLPESTDEMIARYSEINDKYWKMLERGELTKPEVLTGRFREFFATEGIAFDKIEEFNSLYQVRLGDTIVFNDGGYDIVKSLVGRVYQCAVTNGTYTAQEKKLRLSGLEELFDGIFISDKMGYEKPSPEFFDYAFSHMPHFNKDEMLIVGDSLTSDIRGGNNVGIKTCFYNYTGLAVPESLRVDYEITNLNEIYSIIEK